MPATCQLRKILESRDGSPCWGFVRNDEFSEEEKRTCGNVVEVCCLGTGKSADPKRK